MGAPPPEALTSLNAASTAGTTILTVAAYPAHLAREHVLADGRSVLVRPIRPDDEPAEREFFDALSGETRRLRFMKFVRSVSDKLIHFFTHIDYAEHMAFVCEAQEAGARRIVGEARYAGNPAARSCEFGVVIADHWHKTGIAGLLMLALIDAARANGYRRMEGIVLRENPDMLRFVRALGFQSSPEPDDWTLVRATRDL